MSESPEGRAFPGAVELLRDDRLLKDLRDDLNTILDHPFAIVGRTLHFCGYLGGKRLSVRKDCLRRRHDRQHARPPGPAHRNSDSEWRKA
jgi:hypothetical protein